MSIVLYVHSIGVVGSEGSRRVASDTTNNPYSSGLSSPTLTTGPFQPAMRVRHLGVHTSWWMLACLGRGMQSPETQRGAGDGPVRGTPDEDDVHVLCTPAVCEEKQLHRKKHSSSLPARGATVQDVSSEHTSSVVQTEEKLWPGEEALFLIFPVRPHDQHTVTLKSHPRIPSGLPSLWLTVSAASR